MLKEVMSKWSDFSSSDTKPLFLMLLGPLLLMLTLSIATPFSAPFLPLMTVIGLIISWRYCISGFILTLMVFVLYFSLHYFMYREGLLWKIGWGASLALGLTISFLSMEELKSFYSKQKEKKDKIISKLKLSLYNLDEKNAMERRSFEREIEEHKEHHQALQNEVEALLSLVEGSRIESEKIFKHSETLSAKSLTQHRENETMKQELETLQKTIEELQNSNESLSLSAKKWLNALNDKRVELHQSRLLVEDYEKQLRRAREYFLSQKKEIASKEEKPKSIPIIHERKQQLILQTLEKDKGMIKKTYDQIQEEFLFLKKTFKERKENLEKASDEEDDIEVKKLEVQVFEKKKKLEQTRAELIDIEREIFVIKKRLQEKGAFAH